MLTPLKRAGRSGATNAKTAHLSALTELRLTHRFSSGCPTPEQELLRGFAQGSAASAFTIKPVLARGIAPASTEQKSSDSLTPKTEKFSWLFKKQPEDARQRDPGLQSQHILELPKTGAKLLPHVVILRKWARSHAERWHAVLPISI
jgi:hypothetical protein